MIKIITYSPYSRYMDGFELDKVLKEVYGKYFRKNINSYNLQYRFKYNTITKNEYMILYSDRPGLFIGKAGCDIDKVKMAYINTNKHCKGIKFYETKGFQIFAKHNQ